MERRSFSHLAFISRGCLTRSSFFLRWLSNYLSYKALQRLKLKLLKSIFQNIPDISILEEKKPIHETFFVYWQWWVFPVYDYNLCNMISQLKKCWNLIYCMSISKKFFFQQSHTHVQTPSSNGPTGGSDGPMRGFNG